MTYVNASDLRHAGGPNYLGDLIRYRHLCFNLVASTLRARFRRTRLGILWATVQPLTFALIVAAVWANVFHDETYLSYAAYVFSGLVIWEFVSGVIAQSMDSLQSALGYIRQGRIPLIIFQIRVPIVASVILLFGLAGLLGFLVVSGQPPQLGLHLLLLPAFFGLLMLFAIPLSVMFSLLGANFRDGRHIVSVALSGLFFLSPVMFGRSVIAQPGMEILEYINPVVSLLDLFRAPLFDGAFWHPRSLAIFLSWTGALWVLSLISAAAAGRRVVFSL